MSIEATSALADNGRVRLGMVGGGQGAFIGAVHRLASRMDDHYQLCAGALSSDPARAAASGAELGLAAQRCYADFQAMASRERRLKDGIEAVAIVTPNHLHFPVARAFLRAGIHVICDKPLVVSSREARQLQQWVERQGLVFAVTYNYSGYPMVRQARDMVASGELGEIRVVQVEYAQDWLSEKLEDSGQKQASWRTDPARAGAGGCVGDIGTHAFQLAEFVSGVTVESLCAELSSFVPGRPLDDNVQVMLRFHNGARGMLWASQVAPGNENGLRLRVCGSQGGLSWSQEEPNQLWFSPLNQATRRLTRGGPGAGQAAARMTRVPAGHPEGYLEGFANIYTEVAQAIRAQRVGASAPPAVQFPDLADGARGVAFIEATVASSSRGGRWLTL